MLSEIDLPDEGCECPDCRGETEFNARVEDFLTQTRRIVITGEINNVLSANVCGLLQTFSLTKEPIYIYINSTGGSVAAGYAIIDQMSISPCTIYTIIRGQAYSMGAIIAAFGSRGCRYAMPNSSIMLHSIVIGDSPGPIDHYDVMVTYAKGDYRKKMISFAKRLKLSTEQLIKMMNETIWMPPKQAIKIGLIDGIWNKRLEQTANRGS